MDNASKTMNSGNIFCYWNTVVSNALKFHVFLYPKLTRLYRKLTRTEAVVTYHSYIFLGRVYWWGIKVSNMFAWIISESWNFPGHYCNDNFRKTLNCLFVCITIMCWNYNRIPTNISQSMVIYHCTNICDAKMTMLQLKNKQMSNKT